VLFTVHRTRALLRLPSYPIAVHGRSSSLAPGLRVISLSPTRSAALLWRQAGAPTSQPASSGFRALVCSHASVWPQQQLATR
jgi:hypothetical protein